MRHWNYSNLGLIGVIAVFGLSSFLVVVMIFLTLIAMFLPALGTLSDHAFFAFVFFTGFYMLLMLFSRKRRNKTSDAIIVPQAVAQVIAINAWALLLLYLIFVPLTSVKYALNTGEWVGFLVMIWILIGSLFLGIYLGIAILSILSIKKPKRLKRGLYVSPVQIQIINRLFLISVLLSKDFLYGLNLGFINMAALIIILFAPFVGPEKTKSYLRRIFADRLADVFISVIAVVLVIKSVPLREEIDWFNLITGLVLLGGIVLYLLSLKTGRGFVKRRTSRMQKWLRRQLKKLI